MRLILEWEQHGYLQHGVSEHSRSIAALPCKDEVKKEIGVRVVDIPLGLTEKGLLVHNTMGIKHI